MSVRTQLRRAARFSRPQCARICCRASSSSSSSSGGAPPASGGGGGGGVADPEARLAAFRARLAADAPSLEAFGRAGAAAARAGCAPNIDAGTPGVRKPPWLKMVLPTGEAAANYARVKASVKGGNLATVRGAAGVVGATMLVLRDVFDGTVLLLRLLLGCR